MDDILERAERYLAIRDREIRRHIEVFGGYATGGGPQPDEIIGELVSELKAARAENARLTAEPNLSGYLASEGTPNWLGGAFDA